MGSESWGDTTWPAVEAAASDRLVAILPVGAVEAHGPHLPLGTDGIIAEAMARAGVERLDRRGVKAIVLPAIDYTAAPFAAGFAGTIAVRGETVTALIVDIGRSLAEQQVALLAIANAHFDPENLASLYAAVDILRSETTLRVAFPDVTRRPWAVRLTDEFKSGACHAGRYESSVVVAARPELVDEGERRRLPGNPISLSEAIRAGAKSFEGIGGAQAYFGDPAAATAEEGRETIEELARILEESVLAEL